MEEEYWFHLTMTEKSGFINKGDRKKLNWEAE